MYVFTYFLQFMYSRYKAIYNTYLYFVIYFWVVVISKNIPKMTKSSYVNKTILYIPIFFLSFLYVYRYNVILYR